MLTHNHKTPKGIMPRGERKTLVVGMTTQLGSLSDRVAELERVVAELLEERTASSCVAERMDRAENVMVSMKEQLEHISHMIEEDELFVTDAPVEEGYADFQAPPPSEIQMDEAPAVDSSAHPDPSHAGSVGVPSEVSATLSDIEHAMTTETLVDSGEPADKVGMYVIKEDSTDDEMDEQAQREMDEALAESSNAIAARLNSVHVKQPAELKKKIMQIEQDYKRRRSERKRQASQSPRV